MLPTIGCNGIGEMLVPKPWRGEAKNIPFEEYFWINEIKKKVWCRLFEKNPSLEEDYYLPEGYDLYIISFHLEPLDINWVDHVSKNLTAPLIVVADILDADYPVENNVEILSYIYWHRQIELSKNWYPRPESLKKNIKYKASAVCNRVTQSKLLITTALLEEIGPDCMIKLSNWIEEKNVHFFQPSGNKELDRLLNIFQIKYLNKEIVVDEFVNSNQNFQKFTINPWISMLQDCALHFTNETLAYSYMMTDSKQYIYPGPFLTEKTLKCIVGGTAFVSVGQYNTYKILKKLGLDFNYQFDIGWDQNPENLPRLESIVQLIKSLKNYSAQEIFEMTKHSTDHNYDLVWTNKFSQNCIKHNEKTISYILSKYS
jgi:hypothetical protein